MQSNMDNRLSAERLLQYAKERFLEEIDELLNDPSSLIVNHSKEDSRVAVLDKKNLNHYYALAADMGFEFEKLVAARGDTYEQERMRRMLSSEPSDHESIRKAIGYPPPKKRT